MSECPFEGGCLICKKGVTLLFRGVPALHFGRDAEGCLHIVLGDRHYVFEHTYLREVGEEGPVALGDKHYTLERLSPQEEARCALAEEEEDNITWECACRCNTGEEDTWRTPHRLKKN